MFPAPLFPLSRPQLGGASFVTRWAATTILVWSISYTITAKEVDIEPSPFVCRAQSSCSILASLPIQVFSLFLCMDFGDTKSLLVLDSRVTCWVSDDNLSQDHFDLLRLWGTLGILFLVAFPVVILSLM